MAKMVTVDLHFNGNEKRPVVAWVISERVVIHKDPEVSRSIWRVSDPVTGHRYPVYTPRKRDAAEFARMLVGRFGPDPFHGGDLDVATGKWRTEPTQLQELGVFLRAWNYGPRPSLEVPHAS